MSQRLCHELNLVCLLWVASHWRLWSIDWSEGCPGAARTLNKGWMSLLHLIHLDSYSPPLKDSDLWEGFILFSEKCTGENMRVSPHDLKRWYCTGATSKIKLLPCQIEQLWTDWKFHNVLQESKTSKAALLMLVISCVFHQRNIWNKGMWGDC